MLARPMDTQPIRQAILRLNKEQREAVETTEGPLLVLAGAGSGKTRVITVRIAHMLAMGRPASSILAVTFTNKAAREMRSRLGELVGAQAIAPVFLGTFHAFCLALLREHGESIGLPARLVLADSSDQVSGARTILREKAGARPPLQPQELLGRISLWKNKLISPAQAAQQAQGGEEVDQLSAECYAGYEAWLQRSKLLDFDGLLVEAVRLLAERADLCAQLRATLRYCLVDEYQDTNVVQYELLRALVGPNGNLCVVGDDDQSIYAWRGAEIGKILAFEKDFPGAAVVRLETNYRSTPQVLDVANRVIRNNTLRHEKTLRPVLPDGGPVEAFVAPDDVSEADTICLEIKERIARRANNWADFAILFRTSVQPRVFEGQLRVRGIPYILVGGQSFFDRKEVRDVLAYLRVAANPDDEPSLLRILNRPPRGIGQTSVDRVLEFASQSGISAGAAFDIADEVPSLNPAAARSARDLRSNLDQWYRDTHGDALATRIALLLELVGYKSEVTRSYPSEVVQEQRWKAVTDVIEMARNHVKRSKKPSLTRFLAELSLASGETDLRESEPKERPDAVLLSTLHAAKGLEFRQVYLVGLEEGILPHARAVAEGGTEEERRLFYVGATRARERLVMSYCSHRQRGGHKVETHPSRFLLEARGQAPPAGWRAVGEARSSFEETDPASTGRAKGPAKRRSTKRSTKTRAKR